MQAAVAMFYIESFAQLAITVCAQKVKHPREALTGYKSCMSKRIKS